MLFKENLDNIVLFNPPNQMNFTDFRNENTKTWNQMFLKALSKMKPKERELAKEFHRGRANALDEVIETMTETNDESGLLQSFQKWRERIPVDKF